MKTLSRVARSVVASPFFLVGVVLAFVGASINAGFETAAEWFDK